MSEEPTTISEEKPEQKFLDTLHAGISIGYRHAMHDVYLYSLIFFACLLIVRKFGPE